MVPKNIYIKFFGDNDKIVTAKTQNYNIIKFLAYQAYLTVNTTKKFPRSNTIEQVFVVEVFLGRKNSSIELGQNVFPRSNVFPWSKIVET